MKKLWQWLNGNKTIISGALLGLLQTSIVKRNLPPETLEILNWSFGTISALSLGHHISKGYFSVNVGNQGQTLTKDPLKNVQP